MTSCLGHDLDKTLFSPPGHPQGVEVLTKLKCHGGDSCCTSKKKCGDMEGDCDSDDHCAEGLKCGRNNCIGDTFDDSDDCCGETTKMLASSCNQASLDVPLFLCRAQGRRS